MRRRTLFTVVLPVLMATISGAQEPQPRGALSPADEAATFRLADERLTIELVACEPQVDSPVAMAWDADERLYVAEMSDYPLGPGKGRIRLLTDRNGDGRYENATVFADDLNFPNSVVCSRGGVFVTAAPDLWYLKDTDGDGRADERRVVWTGFAEGNQQLRANGLTWGLDNWIYGANGRSDGVIHRPAAAAGEAISIRTRDFRFSPDGQRFEAIAGQSQFGQTRDAWGHRFLSWNTIPIRQALLDPTTLARHPRLISAAIRNIADPADSGQVFPISPRPKTFNREPTDYYNALCGLSIYRGDALGEEYRGNAFVGESLTNLVHRRVLTADGPTFVSHRGEQGREFLASNDSWFHPVFTTTGPDGALYVADFYRRWVEHPHFVAATLRGDVDWREGEGHGRIWRIRRTDVTGDRGQVTATTRGAESLSELVAELEHPNGWRRDTAHRLIIERNDSQSIGLLRDVVRSSKVSLARAHALWTLEGLSALDDSSLVAALHDRSPEVREQALQLAAERRSPSGEISDAIRSMTHDVSLAVRFRMALSLDALSDEKKLAAWVALANQPGASPWLWYAVSGTLDERLCWPYLKQLVRNDPQWLRKPTSQQAGFLRQIAAMLNADADVADAISSIAPSSEEIGSGQLAIVAGLTQAALANNRSLRDWFSEHAPNAGKDRALIAAARRIAVDEQADDWQRIDAIRIAGLDDRQAAAPLLLLLLEPAHPQAVQSAAAATLGALADAGSATQMIADWNSYTAATRRAVAAAALRRPEITALLVEAMEQGEIAPAELDASLRDSLASIRDPVIRERAQKVLAAAAPADRQTVINQYLPAVNQSGDRRRGASIFKQHCLTCHALHGKGHRVGADLSGIATRPRATLLEDVLDPSRQITPNFMSYTLVTVDGQILTGLLAAESPQTVTLIRADGVEETVTRSRIDQLRATGKSLMPDGFDQKLDVSAMADLLDFLSDPSRELLGP